MIKQAVALVVLLLLAFSATDVAGQSPVVIKPYTTGGEVWEGPPLERLPCNGVGGVCVPVDSPHYKSVHIALTDAHGLPVGGKAYFRDASGGLLSVEERVCGAITLSVPELTRSVELHVYAVVGTTICPSAYRAYPATVGTASFTFSTDPAPVP